MANTYKLVLKFKDAAGKSITFNYAHAASSITSEHAKAIMTAFITNGSIFKNVPVTKTACYLVLSNQSEIDINDE